MSLPVLSIRDTDSNVETAVVNTAVCMPIIRLESVGMRLNGRMILENISASMNKDDFIALIGPNGSGKTTMLRIILGLLSPTSGSVTVFGTTPEQGRRHIGYVPQKWNWRADYPITVADAVGYGRVKPGWHPSQRVSSRDREHVFKAMQECGIADLAGRKIGCLSGGELQRVLIARALATEPDLLVLDEPTANIDPSGQESLFDLLNVLNSSIGILIVSHDLGLTTRYVRDVWCLNRTLCTHPTLEMDAETLARVYGFPVRMVDHRPGGGLS